MQAVKDNSIEVLSYSHSAGFASYREKLAKYYERNDIHVSSEDIIVTTGGSEALLFAMGTITDPGDEVIIPEPFYANYNGFATSSGVTIVPIESSIENNFALQKIRKRYFFVILEIQQDIFTPKKKYNKSPILL